MEGKIIKDPYSYIVSWAEDRYPYTGGRVFSYSSLLPISLFLPHIIHKGKLVRPQISVLVLAPSGCAKTDMTNDIKKICYKPYNFTHNTGARIERDFKTMDVATIIINDLSRILKDKEMIKVLESLIEEGQIERKTANYTYDKEGIKCCAYMSGVPQDLTSYITSGLIFRVIPIYISHDLNEQEEIGKDIIQNLEVEGVDGTSLKNIIDYYRTLYGIMSGKSTKYKPVVKIKISEEQRIKIYKNWVRMLEKLEIENNTNWFRELYDGIRMACSLGLLNYFNRKKYKSENGVILELEDSDINIASKLMVNEINVKFKIIMLEAIKKKLMVAKELG